MYEEQLVKRCVFLFFLFFLFLFSFSIVSHAQLAVGDSREQERIYLVQLDNQINAMLPIIRAAEKAQPKNQRVSFHYTAWRDAQGNLHPGLREDVQAIKKGVEEKLNAVSIEPRIVTPIRGDYLQKPH
jgi:RAQPRD family integrative conjugative element protein